jgi:hypothetical protein
VSTPYLLMNVPVVSPDNSRGLGLRRCAWHEKCS